MAKGKIAHDEQFLLWPQCFQLFSIVVLSFIDVFQMLNLMFSKFYANLLYVGGLIFQRSDFYFIHNRELVWKQIQ